MTARNNDRSIPKPADLGLPKFVMDRMKRGRTRSEIEREAIDAGIDPREARTEIEKHYNDIVRQVIHEKPTAGSIQAGIFGALAAAIVAGVAWTYLIIATNTEYGFVAWGIGFLVGYAILFASGKRKGQPLQLIAALCGLLGIAIGKYGYFYHLMVTQISETDPGAAESLSVFSGEVFTEFIHNLGVVFTIHDVLWLLLAVSTAWSVLKATGIKLPPGVAPPYTPM